MPLPLLFIGIAAVTGIYGAGKTVQAVGTNDTANKINTLANDSVKKSKDKLELQRKEVSDSLNTLGLEKIFVLNNSVKGFLNTFEKIKNVDFRNTEGLEELKNLHITQEDFKELKQLEQFAAQVVGGTAMGVASGVLTGLAAWGGAATFAAASTGTAISTLSGAAAYNATLAFFGGGALSAGGLGMAGGTVVLGGLIAGPALAVMGLVVGAKSDEKLDKALANKAQADEIAASLDTASVQCSVIRRRSNMFYNLLAHLDTYMLPLVWNMEDIFNQEGNDYSKYKPESQKTVARAAQTVMTIKSVLDTPILTQDGALTEESEKITKLIGDKIYQ